MTRPTAPTPGSPADDAPPADPAAVARSILLRQLTAGPRTEAQLREVLRRRNVPQDVAEAVIDRYTEVGLIDDAAYADAMIRSEAAAGGLSRQRVRHRLRDKGVPDEIAEAAVLQIDQEDEYRAALDLAMRRVRRLAGYDEPTRRRRLTGLLARRGYGAGTVQRVVEEALAEAD